MSVVILHGSQLPPCGSYDGRWRPIRRYDRSIPSGGRIGANQRTEAVVSPPSRELSSGRPGIGLKEAR